MYVIQIGNPEFPFGELGWYIVHVIEQLHILDRTGLPIVRKNNR